MTPERRRRLAASAVKAAQTATEAGTGSDEDMAKACAEEMEANKGPYARAMELADKTHDAACKALQAVRRAQKGSGSDEEAGDATQDLLDLASTLQAEVNGDTADWQKVTTR
ncbi:hypothetical protein LCGC14_0799450 [marine sediment metagenome]|uniref:Uncharacterized protein n=1 Tax=marine sediment metagenome TaxID=412755 RepID=A0A0F9PQ30_9ZZZZ